MILLLSPMVNAQGTAGKVQGLLPAGAKIIEAADVTAIAGRPRTMVLWMANPTKRDGGSEYCGTAVDGKVLFEGPTRLSLIDTAGRKLINTVRILGRGTDGVGTADSFSIPFLVSNDYYHVPQPDESGWGIPEILHLQDLTGDGIPAEFVVFMYDACGIVSTSVLGYAPDSDRVLQYPVEVADSDGSHVEIWVEQIFATRQTSPGHWKFSWRPGHGTDYVLHEDVSFDRTRKMFVERQTVSPPGPKGQ